MAAVQCDAILTHDSQQSVSCSLSDTAAVRFGILGAPHAGLAWAHSRARLPRVRKKCRRDGHSSIGSPSDSACSARRPQVALLHRLVAAEVAADPMLSVAAHTPDALTLEYALAHCHRQCHCVRRCMLRRACAQVRRVRRQADPRNPYVAAGRPCRAVSQPNAQNTRRTRALCRALVGVCRCAH